ncbi:hypothetical protein AVEN_250203-1 [Araneus ventricosus]|uniref:DNA helicase Pif1-like 2B domain-containing protein n=1 Tax=Araneus ventricosus TaxID=182803 RepID=A0A4Y2FH56_ARAVE|nr:hypothetical protein AVEN_250203-1 [Araneus ventricosus]
MGAEIKAPLGTCPYCFHIHGQIYHMVSPLCANERNRPGYGQLYISDSSEASQDATSVILQSNDGLLNNDGMLTFLDGRYASVPELMWRLHEFSLSEKSRVIMRLAVRLPNQQQVVKKSAVIMLLQNLMPSKGLCNGLYNKADSDKTTA